MKLTISNLTVNRQYFVSLLPEFVNHSQNTKSCQTNFYFITSTFITINKFNWAGVHVRVVLKLCEG